MQCFSLFFWKSHPPKTCLTTEALANNACIHVLKIQSFPVDIHCSITCECIGEASFNDHVINVWVPSTSSSNFIVKDPAYVCVCVCVCVCVLYIDKEDKYPVPICLLFFKVCMWFWSVTSENLILLIINRLKPKTYIMYHQLQHPEILCSAHSAFMCFVWISEQTAITSLYSFNLPVFITEADSVYCAVRNGSLNQTGTVSYLKG